MEKIKIKNLVLKFSLLHEININTLKYLVDKYGVLMSYENDNKFKIEYVYNGENKIYYQKRNWIINFIKKDYLNQNLFLSKAA